MGLIDEYDHIRSHILVIDPKPFVDKAMSMILSIVKHREVNVVSRDKAGHVAMLAKTSYGKNSKTHIDIEVVKTKIRGIGTVSIVRPKSTQGKLALKFMTILSGL